jgi:hypothetical protein
VLSKLMLDLQTPIVSFRFPAGSGLVWRSFRYLRSDRGHLKPALRTALPGNLDSTTRALHQPMLAKGADSSRSGARFVRVPGSRFQLPASNLG